MLIEEVAFSRYGSMCDVFLMFMLAALENFGFRQLNTFWRARGLLSSITGRKAVGQDGAQGLQGRARRGGRVGYLGLRAPGQPSRCITGECQPRPPEHCG